MTFAWTEDLALVRSLILPVYDQVRDDFAPPADRFQPDPAQWLLARDGEEIAALWLLAPHSRVCWEFHSVLSPAWRGKRAIALFRQMFAWVFNPENTECRRLLTNVPEFNRPAGLMARWIGMETIGVNRKAFLRDGRLQNLTLFGISPSG